MADGDSTNNASNLSDERFKYIGFDVFPGKAGDIFKSEEERKSLVERVKAKLSHSQGEVRERCTLIEKRISGMEKGFLTAAAVFLLIAFLLPWFSGYVPVSYQELGSVGSQQFFFASQTNDKAIGFLATALKNNLDRKLKYVNTAVYEDDTPPMEEQPAMTADSMAVSAEQESSTPEATEPAANDQEQSPGSETASTGAEEGYENRVPDEINVVFLDVPDMDQIHGLEDLKKHIVARLVYNGRSGLEQLDIGADQVLPQLSEDVLGRARVNDSISTAVTDSLRQAAMALAAKGDTIMSVDSIFYAGPVLATEKPVKELAMKGIVNDSYSMTGLAMIGAIGAYGSMVFGGGIVLKITGILLLLYIIGCIVLALFNLYVLYGVKKKSADDYALYLKKMLKLNWVPVIFWLAIFVLSFVGAQYGAPAGDATKYVAQVGDVYGVGAFIGLASFGMYITLAGFLILALKGKEI